MKEFLGMMKTRLFLNWRLVPPQGAMCFEGRSSTSKTTSSKLKEASLNAKPLSTA